MEQTTWVVERQQQQMKKRLEATQTLRAGCSKGKHTNRQGRLQYTAQLSAQCND